MLGGLRLPCVKERRPSSTVRIIVIRPRPSLLSLAITGVAGRHRLEIRSFANFQTVSWNRKVSDEKHPPSETILPEASSPDDAPGLLTNHAARIFNRHVDNMLRPHGLPFAHLSPLIALHHNPTMLQRDLVKACGIAQPAMVNALSKLEEAGLIARKRDTLDRRASTISITPERMARSWPRS